MARQTDVYTLHTQLPSLSVGWRTHSWRSASGLRSLHVRLLRWWWWRRQRQGWRMAWRVVTSLIICDILSHTCCRVTQLLTLPHVHINPTSPHAPQYRTLCSWPFSQIVGAQSLGFNIQSFNYFLSQLYIRICEVLHPFSKDHTLSTTFLLCPGAQMTPKCHN